MQLWVASAKQFHIPTSALFTACLAMLITSSWAENNSNYVFNGTTTNFGGPLNIPMLSPGTNNSLQILNGGAVTNTDGRIGNGALDNFNFALITDTNSLWINTLDLYLGDDGAFNRMTITNGARVDSRDGYIGFFATSRSNRVLITGPGSVWNSSRFFQPGVFGSDNQLIITNGGRVNSVDTYIGATLSSNTLVVVAGEGSIWTNTTTLRVGYFTSSNNRLIIANSGQVHNVTGRIGSENAFTRDNTVIVDGAGALWNNTGVLSIGYNGSGNTLIVTNGGRVNSTQGFLGHIAASASNNTVIVTGAGSLWTNSLTGGNNGVTVGASGDGNQLIISDGGRVDSFNGFLGFSSANNTALITGSNSLWNTGGAGSALEVGVLGVGNNSMTITNGGRVNANEGYIANGGSNNTVLVTGAGSAWSNGATLFVGFGAGHHNSLTISDGARVDSVAGRIGNSAGSSNNVVLVDGSNSLWNATGILSIGYQGAGNTLIITNGGRVNSTQGFLGHIAASASNNTVIVTGAGSLWTNSLTGGNNGVTVGASGDGNQLIISDGGRVDSFNGFLGFSSANNTALITGSNSLWNTGGAGSALEVGVLGVGNNSMTIANGGRVNANEGYIANGGTNNTVLVTGAGSAWSNTATLFVGFGAGHHNSLTISDGARVDSVAGRIGNSAGSSNNVVVVDGSNSLWNASNILSIGFDGARNTLIVTNGGRVNSFHGDLGSSSGSAASTLASNNLVIVTGAGSQWTNSSTTGENGIKVGNYASGNQLIISAGGRADGQDMYVGRFLGSDNNSVTVTGSNSLLNLTRFFDVGTFGRSNQLTVSDGGRVNNVAETRIGAIAGANNNKAVVAGSGSIWSNQSNLVVGDAGTGNELIVTNGGAVFAANVLVGRGSAGSGSILVEGDGSLLQSSALGTLRVGNTGTTLGSGSVLIRNRGTLEINTLISGSSGSGTISNRQGIYQFTTATPTITPNTAGSIAMSDATISYRGVASANINNAEVGEISKQGDNTFRLNNSTNLLVNGYTFEASAITGNPSNYYRLALINGSRWQSGNLTIGTNGVITGATESDVVNIRTNFLIHSTQNTEFDLANSTVLFSGTGDHTNAITGLDLGGESDAGYFDNFAYGVLRLDSAADEICFQSGNNAASNALYVGWLDLPSSMTNYVMNLHAPTNINLYYYVFDPRNAYLNGMDYQLTDCDGTTVGGFLLPAVPEPSALALLLAAGALSIARVRRARR